MYTQTKNGTAKTATPTEALPPHNEDMEQAVLGSLVIDPDSIPPTLAALTPAAFYFGRNRQVYEAIGRLHAANQPVDIMTIENEIGSAADPAYIISLVNVVPTAINISHYVSVVQDCFMRRQLIKAAGKIASLAYDQESDTEDVLAEAETAVLDIRRGVSKQTATSARAGVLQVLDDLEHDNPPGIATGYADLDRCIGGLEPGNGYWFCAAEKMGKTSFVSGISRANALAGKVVLRFSLEMTAVQRTRRDLAAMTAVPVQRIKQRQLSEIERNRLFQAAGVLSDCAIITDDTPGITPTQMRATCNQVLQRYGRIDLVEVDYFQLIGTDRPRNDRRTELEDVSWSLVNLARELKTPLIGTAQVLSKSIDTRSDKRPNLSDVFGSSALQKDGYFIGFIYRDEYYNPQSTLVPGQAELIIRAHRDGDLPILNFQFDGPTAQFRNLARR